jgi:SNF2 family DNA or RNA helicase
MPVFNPHNYQTEAIDFLLRHRCGGIFADPGLGKTAIALSVLERFKQSPKFTGALIVAPLRVVYNTWPAEIKKWGFDISFEILHGPDKEARLRRPADVHLINPEGIFWLFDHQKLPYKALIIDESSKFKSWRSKRFKVLKKRLKNFQRRIILTGTPAPNSLLDLWSQMYIVDLGQTLGTYVTHFRERYFYRTGYNLYQWSIKDGADAEIQNSVAPAVMRIDAKTHLDLPALVENIVPVELPGQARALYRGMEKQLFVELDDEQKVAAATSGVAYNYCCQIANGAIYNERKEVQQIHDAKVEATADLVDELQGKPVLIAYRFKHDLENLLKQFPKAAVIGRCSAKQDAEYIAEWNKGQVPILIAQSAAIAHGLNLQHGGHDIIWYGLTDNLEDYIQFNRRIYRQGVEGQVRIHHLVAKDTVDEAIMARLRRKDKSQTALLDALKEYRNRDKEADVDCSCCEFCNQPRKN